MPESSLSPLALGVAFLGVTLLFGPPSSARSRGMEALDCSGCHGSHNDSSVSLEVTQVELGATVELVFTVADPDAVNGGIYIAGDADLQAGTGMATVGSGATHTSPHAFQGGKAQYSVIWNVPSEPGATRFSAAAVAGNGDGRNSGDEGVAAELDVVYGCSPQVFHYDGDGDGYGKEGLDRIFCAGDAPPGFAAELGDCVDYREEVHPGAVELCNRIDDDCDGDIDEDAIEVPLYPDADGDGYYSTDEYLSGDVVMGCVPYEGYAAERGDCDPSRPEINPGAEEVCDGLFDENCDGRVDDRLRPICGEGWCARESRSCSPDDCVPGAPRAELCNFFDDDCDGEIDNGDLCPEGQVCAAGQCLDVGDVDPADPGGAGGSSSTAGGTGGLPSRSGGDGGTGGGESPGDTSGGGGDPPRPAAPGCSLGASSRSSSQLGPPSLSFLVLLALGLFLRRGRAPAGAGLPRRCRPRPDPSSASGEASW